MAYQKPHDKTPADQGRAARAWNPHPWALGTFVALTLVLVFLFFTFRSVDVWANWRESGELRNVHYSETVYVVSVFRTRANTWSNLAFVLVGFYALAFSIRDRRLNVVTGAPGYHTTPPVLTALFGVACVYLGLGSGIFHASLTRWGQQLDVASMYPPMLAQMAMLLRRNGLSRLPALRSRDHALTWTLVALVVAAGVYLYVYKWSMSSGKVLPFHVLALAIGFALDALLWRPWGKFRWLGLSFLALVAGVTCRQLDVAGRFSGPDAWYQGHAIWHLLCALSLALGWWYIRSGEPGRAEG